MLYVIYGTDTKKVREKSQSLIATLLKKRPDASLFRMNKDNWNSDLLGESVSTVSLFSPKNIIVLDSLLSDDESAAYVSEHFTDFKQTEHVCVLIEEKISKDYLKGLTATAEKIEEHELKVSGSAKREAPQTFALADALVMKDSKKAFRVFYELKEEGLPAEEIHGVLWWQFKTLFLVKGAKTAKEADVSPYAFSKCKTAEKNWSDKELNQTLEKLVTMYHKAHRGEIDFMSDLEKMCLG